MRTSTKQAFREIILLFTLILLVVFSMMLVRAVLFGKREERKISSISLLLEDIPKEGADALQIGDRVLDRGRRTILGTIEEITIAPHLYESASNGESVSVEKAGFCDITLHIRIEQENRRNHDGGLFYIGASMSISTHSLSANGTINALDEGGDNKNSSATKTKGAWRAYRKGEESKHEN